MTGSGNDRISVHYKHTHVLGLQNESIQYHCIIYQRNKPQTVQGAFSFLLIMCTLCCPHEKEGFEMWPLSKKKIL